MENLVEIDGIKIATILLSIPPRDLEYKRREEYSSPLRREWETERLTSIKNQCRPGRMVGKWGVLFERGIS